MLPLPSAGEESGGGNEFSELEPSIRGNSSTDATAEMQGLRLIDCQSSLASVRKGARCADCSSPLDVRGKWVPYWCVVMKLHCFSLLGRPTGA